MLLRNVSIYTNKYFINSWCLSNITNLILTNRLIHKNSCHNGSVLRFLRGKGLALEHNLNRGEFYLRPNHVMFSSYNEDIDPILYEAVCEETLDSLCEFFEDIIDQTPALKTADVSMGDGVLTVNLAKHGTYVINRQLPNKQIWLSSPTSGPKRYDFVRSRNGWVYRHDSTTLHALLQQELSAILRSSIDLSGCAYSGSVNQ